MINRSFVKYDISLPLLETAKAGAAAVGKSRFEIRLVEAGEELAGAEGDRKLC